MIADGRGIAAKIHMLRAPLFRYGLSFPGTTLFLGGLFQVCGDDVPGLEAQGQLPAEALTDELRNQVTYEVIGKSRLQWRGCWCTGDGFRDVEMMVLRFRTRG